MWLTIAIVYCLICWLVGFVLARFVYRRELIDLAAKTGIPLFLLEILAVLTAPLLLPCLISVSLPCLLKLIRQIQLLNRLSRTYRPYEFLEVNSLLVDASIREQFESNTPSLTQLGFNLLGDYRLKPQPLEVYDRLFLSADGDILAAICALLNSGAVSLISVLEDGTCVHTTSAENPHLERTLEPADRLVISYVPDASIEDLYRHHANALHDCSAIQAAGVLRFGEDQFRAVMIYDQLIFCRWRYRYGGLDHEPPAPDFGSLRTAQVVSVR